MRAVLLFVAVAWLALLPALQAHGIQLGSRFEDPRVDLITIFLVFLGCIFTLLTPLAARFPATLMILSALGILGGVGHGMGSLDFSAYEAHFLPRVLSTVALLLFVQVLTHRIMGRRTRLGERLAWTAPLLPGGGALVTLVRGNSNPIAFEPAPAG